MLPHENRTCVTATSRKSKYLNAKRFSFLYCKKSLETHLLEEKDKVASPVRPRQPFLSLLPQVRFSQERPTPQPSAALQQPATLRWTLLLSRK